MNACIVTICDLNNYGNRLQNYATQQVLTQLGLETTTMWYRVVNRKEQVKFLIHMLLGFRVRSGQARKLNYLRKRNFERFNKDYILTNTVHSLSDIGEADYYVLGSDQVWNPRWYAEQPLKQDLFLLTFAEPEKKVCFAPSFGEAGLPVEWKAYFIKHIKAFPRISVREEAGAKLVGELTGQDATVLIDPTLMLSKEDWDEIAHPINRAGGVTGKAYIMTYFLGECPKEAEDLIQTLIAERKLDVVRCNDATEARYDTMNPSEWLWTIAHADLVLTDSFHGSVFSFIYDKPFLVYHRQDASGSDMHSRIDTLLSTFALERKAAENALDNSLFEADYALGKQILAKKQKECLDFLKESMGIS